MTRLLAAAAALFMLSLTISSPSYAQRTGVVRIDVAKAGLIIGFQNGTGTLTFRGRRYPLAVRGVGAVWPSASAAASPPGGEGSDAQPTATSNRAATRHDGDRMTGL